jgi:uncharacterized protein YoxC
METNHQSALKDVLAFAEAGKNAIDSVRSTVYELEKNQDTDTKETKKAVEEAKKILEKIDSKDGLMSLEKALEKLKNISLNA